MKITMKKKGPKKGSTQKTHTRVYGKKGSMSRSGRTCGGSK